MLAVLAILGVVLAGLTQLFVSASKSQVDQTSRARVQQDGRIALDQLRRELHCGSLTSLASASSLTATLPSYCPTVPSTTLSSAATIPASGTFTVPVGSTSNFNTGGNTISFGSSGPVTCTGTTSTSFTGCSGGIAGLYAFGTKAISPVTWCATGSSLKRFVGALCSGSSGKTWAGSLTSTSIFTQPVVPAPSCQLPCPSSTGGTLGAGTYAYEVTAVTSTGEIVGTLAHPSIASGATNKITLTWSSYSPPSGTLLSYNVYGRDDYSYGLRLLGNTGSTTFTDGGPTSLTSNPLTLPNSTIPVVSTVGFNPGGSNTISFGPSGNVTCTGTTSTSFTGCSGGAAGQYAQGTVVRNASSVRPPLATLSVSLVLDKTPADTKQRFTVNDDIDLRNSRPF
jgi:type II secretory pathway pseudopilin PulG